MSFEILVIIILILLNGIFSTTELAVVSCRRGRLEKDADRGSRRARAVLRLIESPNQFLSTVQVGITLVGIIAGVYGGATITDDLARWLSKFSPISHYATPIAVVITISLITYFSLIIGELVPKRLAMAHPEAIAKTFAPFIDRLGRLCHPLVWCLERSTPLVVFMLGLRQTDEGKVTEEDIKFVVSEGLERGVLANAEAEIVSQALKLGDRRAGNLMTPRTRVTSLDILSKPQEILRTVGERPHHQYPVFRGSPDTVVGYLSLKQLMVWVQRGHSESIEKFLSTPLMVPVSASGVQVLEQFRKANTHFAVVIDEHGNFEGVLTLHDLLEALVGELSDSPATQPIVERADGSLLVDASIDVHVILERLGLHDAMLSDSSYHSFGGFLFHRLGKIPKEGEVFEIEGYRMEIVDMDQHRIDKVLIQARAKE